MKKLVSILFMSVMAVTAQAKNPFTMLPVPELELERPYIDLSYAEINYMSTEKTDKEAYFEGALRYYYGYSKRLDIPFPKDYRAAALWFYEAGMLDQPVAAYYMGNMHLIGQGVDANVKDAFWWLEKAKANGLKEATHQLANLYFDSFEKSNVPESYKILYLKQTHSYLDELIADNYAYAYYNKALVRLKTEDLTRFVRSDIDELMMKALYGLIQLKNKVASYDVLKVMSYYKLKSHSKAEKIFNEAFGKD